MFIRRSVSPRPRMRQISTAPPGVTALPAAAMRTGHMTFAFFAPSSSASVTIAVINLKNMFLGNMPGCIGEISALALLIGVVYLFVRKVITWRIPTAFIGTVVVLTFIFGHEGYSRIDWVGYNLLCGSLLLGAFFMANDYATSPVTGPGQLLYGVGCGAITVLIRYFGSYPEGVSYAILIMNLCTWAIDKAFRRHQFGVSKEDIAAEKAAKKAAKEGA